jgi:hypothetical protein
MTRRTFRVAAALLLVFAVAFSGCFAIRGSSLTNKALGTRERTIVRVDMMPYARVMQTSDKVFMLVGWNKADRVLPARFDTQGNWGGPHQGKNTVSLANQLLESGACGSNGLWASDLETHYDNWEAWHTRVNVDATSLTRPDFDQRLRAIIRMQRPAGTVNGEIGEVVIFSGGWSDTNNNDVYDAGEEAVCTGFASFTIPYVD